MRQQVFLLLSPLDRLEGGDFKQGTREASRDKMTLEVASECPEAEETAKGKCQGVWLDLEETLLVYLA